MTRLTHWEGEPTRVWEEVWGIPGFEAWSSVDSTNERAREWALEGARPWSVVLAEAQRAGRGRAGRRWVSEAGRGLWFSLVVPQRRGALELMPLRTCVAVLDVLGGLLGLRDVGLKWPNDLWWQDRKLGGILCEKQVRGSDAGGAIVGVGLNLATPSGGEFDVSPVGLDALVPGPISRAQLLGGLVRRIRTTLEQGAPRLSVSELTRIAERDRLLNRVVRCTDGPGGIARGIGADGGLHVETEEGVRSVRTGSVRPVGRIRESGGATR